MQTLFSHNFRIYTVLMQSMNYLQENTDKSRWWPIHASNKWLQIFYDVLAVRRYLTYKVYDLLLNSMMKTTPGCRAVTQR